MTISTKGRYGLRAMVELASCDEGTTLSLNTIAKRQGISNNYLERLIAPLKKAGFVKSVRGSFGGYVIEKNSEDITAGDILRVLEGELISTDCGSMNPEVKCALNGDCATKLVWHKIDEAVNTAVDSITLKQLADEHRKLFKPNG